VSTKYQEEINFFGEPFMWARDLTL